MRYSNYSFATGGINSNSIFSKNFKEKIYCIYQCELKLADGLINKIIEIILILINIIVCFLSDKIITNTNDFAVNSTVLKFF